MLKTPAADAPIDLTWRNRRCLSKGPQDYNLGKAGCTRGRSFIWPDFWREKLDSLKSQHPLRKDTILREGIALIRMATSQPTEIPTEGEVDVNEAVKEILAEMEAEEQDPLEGLGNVQIAEIYHRRISVYLDNLKGFISSTMRPTDMTLRATS